MKNPAVITARPPMMTGSELGSVSSTPAAVMRQPAGTTARREARPAPGPARAERGRWGGRGGYAAARGGAANLKPRRACIGAGMQFLAKVGGGGRRQPGQGDAVRQPQGEEPVPVRGEDAGQRHEGGQNEGK